MSWLAKKTGEILRQSTAVFDHPLMPDLPKENSGVKYWDCGYSEFDGNISDPRREPNIILGDIVRRIKFGDKIKTGSVYAAWSIAVQYDDCCYRILMGDVPR